MNLIMLAAYVSCDVSAVRAGIFQLLGSLCEVYPEHMITYSERLVDIYMRTLRTEVCVCVHACMCACLCGHACVCMCMCGCVTIYILVGGIFKTSNNFWVHYGSISLFAVSADAATQLSQAPVCLSASVRDTSSLV